MESSAAQAPEAQCASGANASHEHSLSRFLSAFLTEGNIDPEGSRALQQSCTSPMALVVICHFSNRCPLQLGDVDECLKNSHISYVATVTDDSIVALVSYANVRAFIESFNDKSKIGRHIAAFSLPFDDINDIPRQYELIKYCLRSQKSEGTLDTKDDALGFLVSRISSVIDAKSLLHPALDKLARYDEENQTDLLNTLDVYLKYDRNAQRCANALYLHRNSLQYRVRRIQEIADINLDDAKERTYLRLSFLIS